MDASRRLICRSIVALALVAEVAVARTPSPSPDPSPSPSPSPTPSPDPSPSPSPDPTPDQNPIISTLDASDDGAGVLDAIAIEIDAAPLSRP